MIEPKPPVVQVPRVKDEKGRVWEREVEGRYWSWPSEAEAPMQAPVRLPWVWLDELFDLETVEPRTIHPQ